MQTTLGVDVLGVVAARPRCTRSRRRATAASACWRRPRPWRSGAYAAAIAAADPFVRRRPASPAPTSRRSSRAASRSTERVVDTVRALLRAAARGRRRHGDPRLHALPARARRCSSACSAAASTIVTSGEPRRAPGRARARLARAGEPAATGEGDVPLPVHRRRRGVPRARHALPAAAARRGRARSRLAVERPAVARRDERPRAQRRPRAPTSCGRSTIEPGFVRTATGSALISMRRDARDLHRLGRRRACRAGWPARAAAGSRPSTGCCPRRRASASSATSPRAGRTAARSRSSG